MDTRDIEDMNTLSECRVKNVRSLIQIRIKKLGGSVSAHATLILKDQNVAKHLSRFHDKYVVVPADKAPNNIVFVCKSHYIDYLIRELGIDNSPVNPTYIYLSTLLNCKGSKTHYASISCSVTQYGAH